MMMLGKVEWFVRRARRPLRGTASAVCAACGEGRSAEEREWERKDKRRTSEIDFDDLRLREKVVLLQQGFGSLRVTARWRNRGVSAEIRPRQVRKLTGKSSC